MESTTDMECDGLNGTTGTLQLTESSVSCATLLTSGMWKPHPFVHNAHAQRGRYHGINITQYRVSALPPHQFLAF